MPAIDPKVIDGLQSTCQMLTQLSMQYRVYKMNVKFFGIKWLCHKLKDHYSNTEDQLDIFLKRIFFYGEDPSFDIGSVSGADKITAILEHLKELVDGLLEFAVQRRKEAMDSRQDYTPDLYEHLIDTMECQCMFLTQQLTLIAEISEKGYIASRLED